MLHACSALSLFLSVYLLSVCSALSNYDATASHKRKHGVKMGDGSAQFLWIFAICRKTELSDNENEVNRPHLVSTSRKEGECCASCRTPSSDPHSNRKLLPTKHSTLHTANNETQHIAHCTHAYTRVEKNRRRGRKRAATTRNFDWNMTFNIWMLWINLWLHFAVFQLTLSHYIAISAHCTFVCFVVGASFASLFASHSVDAPE